MSQVGIPADEPLYNLLVRELFAHLAHAGALGQADKVCRVSAGSYDQGAQAVFSVAFCQDRIEAVRYRAYGCPHFLAACEWSAVWMEGRPWSELAEWSWRDIEELLNVPAAKRARLLLLDDLVRQIQNLQPR